MARTVIGPEEVRAYMEYLEKSAAPYWGLQEDGLQELYEESMMQAYAY